MGGSFSSTHGGDEYIVGGTSVSVTDANTDSNFSMTGCCDYRYAASDGSDLTSSHPLYTRNGVSIVSVTNTNTNSMAFNVGGIPVSNKDWGFNSNGYETLYF